MGYVDHHLLDGERVVFRTRPHWILLAGPAGLVVVGAAVSVAPVVSGRPGWWSYPGLAIAVIGLAMLAARAVRRLTSEFAVTNLRVVMKVGILARRSDELLLQKVETIGVDQGILGRLLGYGTLTVTGTGGAHEPFPLVSDPLAFRRAVQEQSLRR